MKKIILWISGILVFYLGVIILAWIIQKRLIFFPQTLESDHIFHFRESFEERYFSTAENVTVHSLLFRSTDPKGIILYFHGNAGNLDSWGDIAPDLIQTGYDLLMIDYRGYGKSTGKITEQGLYHDAVLISNTILKEYPDQRYVIYGRSLGSGIASYLASVSNPDVLILETPFSSLESMARRYYPWFPRFLIRFGFRNDLHIRQVRCPVYILHGTFDEVVPFPESQKLSEAMKPEDQFYPIRGGHHNDLATFPEYHNILHRILE